MARDPRETWAKLQQTLQSAQQQGRRGFGGGSPRSFFAGGAGLILLVGGTLVFNNALFNGTLRLCFWDASRTKVGSESRIIKDVEI